MFEHVIWMSVVALAILLLFQLLKIIYRGPPGRRRTTVIRKNVSHLVLLLIWLQNRF